MYTAGGSRGGNQLLGSLLLKRDLTVVEGVIFIISQHVLIHVTWIITHQIVCCKVWKDHLEPLNVEFAIRQHSYADMFDPSWHSYVSSDVFEQAIDCNSMCQVIDLSSQCIHMGKINHSHINDIPSTRGGPILFKINTAKLVYLTNTLIYHFKNYLLVSF